MDEVEDLKNQIKVLNQQLKESHDRIKSLEGSLSFPFFKKSLTGNDVIDNRTDSLYQLIYESLKEGVVFFNAQGEVEVINDGAKEILGFNLLELQKKLGKIRLNMVDENYQIIPVQEQPAVLALTSKKPIVNSQVGIQVEGENYKWILVNAQPVYNYNDEFIGVVLSVIDITDIKLKRDELKQAKIDLGLSEHSLKIAQEISHTGSFVWFLKTGKLEWSDELFRILNVSKEGFNNSYQFYLDNLIFPEDRWKLEKRSESIKQQKLIEPIEYRIKLPDGKTRVLWSHPGKVFFDEEGQPDISIGVVMDITDRKKEEEKKLFMQANQQALRLESLRFLAGGIAHDFNNLLGGIYGFIDLALNESQEPNVQSYLKGAFKSMGRARSLTDKLITFTESGDPNREVTSMNDLIVDTANFVLSGSSISCEFNISKDLWYCEIDKGQMEQVIENIVLNAMQSMDEKGNLFISAENIINDGPLETAKLVQITIRDTGRGMTKDILDHVFEPFFTTRKEGGGRGLGLATSYSVVKKHDGVIKVESEVNKGCTFTILLPASDKSLTTEKPAQYNSQSHHGKGLIIILDDEEDIREILKLNLQKLGYSVITKTRGEEILEILKDKQLVENLKSLFLDLTIPGGLGGKDLIDELRKQYPSMPIYVISGYSDDPIITRPQDYGFTASLKKPFTRKEIEKLLNQYIEE